MIEFLAYSLGLSLIINIAMFLVAFKLQSDKLTDASYAVTFIVLAVYSTVIAGFSAFHLVLLATVVLWAIRLGSFLLYRVSVIGKDSRFDQMRGNFVKFSGFWILQAVTVWVLMLPVLLASQHDTAVEPPVIVGLIIWLVGLSIEAIADLQKFRFSQKPENKGKWIESGIWKYSRHPNYFGEIMVWLGVYMIAVQALPIVPALVALASPLFIATLLLFVSGIPLLEKAADARWGDNPKYKAYKRRTSILIPLPPRGR